MGNVKGLLQSKTIWSVLFMIAMAVGGQRSEPSWATSRTNS